jgi:hypothetical protein
MRGAIQPLPQYDFMAWCSFKNSAGTTLPFMSLSFTKTFKVQSKFMHGYQETHTSLVGHLESWYFFSALRNIVGVTDLRTLYS